MKSNYALAIAPGMGVIAGLRAVTAPALLSWAARLKRLNLRGTPLKFMGSTAAIATLSAGALAEYVNDTLPKTPSRTSPSQLIPRIVTGGLSGACVYAAARRSLVSGAALGAVGAVAGAFGGYQARTRLGRALRVRDTFVAVPEDLLAIGLGYLLVSLPIH